MKRVNPKRRWLRFSIRTMLIAVTIFCLWVGWQVSIVRERKSLVGLVSQRQYVTLNFWPDPNVDLSWLRRLLGDQLLHATIFVPDGSLSDQERRDIERALPEARIAFGKFSSAECGIGSFDL
jgi:hypothetical protein